MSVTVAVRFPLGRYHATPWDRSVNEGVVEWPPSPWRLLRSLVSTWYTRWPDLSVSVLDGLLDALGDPPSYRVPAGSPGHTRHYLPDLNHRKGEPGGTDLTLDPFIRLPRDQHLLVRWPVDLTGEQRETLSKLVELVPYVGRAESVCEARLLPVDAPGGPPDGTWWRPAGEGAEVIRLLAPSRPVQRAALELGTVEVRRRRRTLPPGTTWVTYRRQPVVPESPTPDQPATDVDAIRFAVVSKAPLTAANGVLLADEAHRRVTRALDGGRSDVVGHEGAATDHRHAHWVPLPDGSSSTARVGSVLIWVPARLTQDEIAKIMAPRILRDISGRRAGEDGYEVKGLPTVDLLLQGAGPVETVAPELCGPARRWRSLTPYLPVRHHKPRRESLAEFLATDVCTELSYRHRPGTVAVRPDDERSGGWAAGYRRYRLRERRSAARQGVGLRLEFDREVYGPLLLGQLSHFGYGVFIPDDRSVA